jgi:hypothetical protein
MALGGQHVERVGADLCLILGGEGINVACLISVIRKVSGWLPS